MEITKAKITDIFCIIDDLCEEYDKDIEKNESEGIRWTQTP